MFYSQVYTSKCGQYPSEYFVYATNKIFFFDSYKAHKLVHLYTACVD